MASCYKCGMELPQTGQVCPYCGKKRLDITPAGCLVAILLIGGFVGYSCWNESSERAAKQRQESVNQANREEDLRLEKTLRDELRGKGGATVSARLGEPSHRSDSNSEGSENWSYTDKPKPWLCVYFKSGVVDDVRIISVHGER